jgi:hypothetical protein
VCSSSRFGPSTADCFEVSLYPVFLFLLLKGGVKAAPAGWQWFPEEYPKGHNRAVLYVAEQGTQNLSPMLSPCALPVNLADTAGSPGDQPLTKTKGPQDTEPHRPLLPKQLWLRPPQRAKCLLGERLLFRTSTCLVPPPPHSPGSPAEEVRAW